MKVRNAENKDPKGFQFSVQVLQSPILDDRSSYKSSALTFNDWTSEASRLALRVWLGGIYNSLYVPEDAMPLRATNFFGLPPIYIQIGELDHDKDSQIKYAQN